MCKQYGVEVLISGRMRRLAGDAFLARRIDRVVAYGRRGATDIYELVATQGTARPDQVAPHGPARYLVLVHGYLQKSARRAGQYLAAIDRNI